MVYSILSDIVLLIHFGWILFTIFGSLIAYRYLWLKWVHIGMLVYGLLIEIFAWICPLTIIENYLLEKAHPGTGYTGDFITHYLDKIIYMEVSQIWLIVGAIVVVILNSGVYYFAAKKNTVHRSG